MLKEAVAKGWNKAISVVKGAAQKACALPRYCACCVYIKWLGRAINRLEQEVKRSVEQVNTQWKQTLNAEVLLEWKHNQKCRRLASAYAFIKHALDTKLAGQIIKWICFFLFCFTPIIFSVLYILSRFIFCQWLTDLTIQIIFWSPLGSVLDFARVANAIEYSALGNVVMSIGLTGALFSWLLQIITDHDCGVEMGLVFKWKFPKYICNLGCFILSTAICIYGCGSKKLPNIPWPLIYSNILAMSLELLYMCNMCRKLLFYHSMRKDLTHEYLLNQVVWLWNDSAGHSKWYCTELQKLIDDFPNSMSAHASKFDAMTYVLWAWMDKIQRILLNTDSMHFKTVLSETENLLLMFLNSTDQNHWGELLGCIARAAQRAQEDSKAQTDRFNDFLQRNNEIKHELIALGQYFTSGKWKTQFDAEVKRWDSIRLKINDLQSEIKQRDAASCQANIYVIAYYLLLVMKNNSELNVSLDCMCEMITAVFSDIVPSKGRSVISEIQWLHQEVWLIFLAVVLCEGNSIALKLFLLEVFRKNQNELHLQFTHAEADKIFIHVRGMMNIINGVPYDAESTFQGEKKVYEEIIDAL